MLSRLTISPGIQGERAFDELNAEQKCVLIHALNEKADRMGLVVRPMSSWLRGYGDLWWGYERKTTKNRRPALKIKVRPKIEFGKRVPIVRKIRKGFGL